MPFDNRPLFPFTADIDAQDRLTIGGCDTVALAAEFGTPLLVFDEVTLRAMCREFVNCFGSRYANSQTLYASKAFVNAGIARLVQEEGLGLDVVSGGELAVAVAAGVDMSRVYFHGNNKTPDELEYALEVGCGRIVVDSFYELRLLNDLARERGATQDILLRLSPSVDPHTHVATTTGILDSKFGFSIETGDSTVAIRQAIAASNLDLLGLHFHLGSPIFELEPYELAIDTVLDYLAPFKDEGLDMREFSPAAASPSDTCATSAPGDRRVRRSDNVRLQARLRTSRLRRADVAHRTGTLHRRTRPASRSTPSALSKTSRPSASTSPSTAEWETTSAPRCTAPSTKLWWRPRMSDAPSEVVTLAGKYCESGDILVRDIEMPALESGDVIAIPSSGAYAPSMASNYNLNGRPAIVVAREGEAR